MKPLDPLSQMGGAIQVIRMIAKSARDVGLNEVVQGKRHRFDDMGHAVCVGAAKGFLEANHLPLDEPDVKEVQEQGYDNPPTRHRCGPSRDRMIEDIRDLMRSSLVTPEQKLIHLGSYLEEVSGLG